jgi:hypothetical protein
MVERSPLRRGFSAAPTREGSASCLSPKVRHSVPTSITLPSGEGKEKACQKVKGLKNDDKEHKAELGRGRIV